MITAYILIAIGIISLLITAILVLKIWETRNEKELYDRLIQGSGTTRTLTKSYIRDKDFTLTMLESEQDSGDTLAATELETELMDTAAVIKDADNQYLEIEKKLQGLYRVDKILGEGNMGQVYLCTNLKLGNQWAVKHVPYSSNELMIEEEILKKLNHINLPQIVDLFHDKTGSYIVQSYIEGESLDIKIKKNELLGQAFSEEQVTEWGKQVAEVLAYLHSRKPYPIVHRDLKPSNIMITEENKVVIIDFGISKEQAGHIQEIKAATLNYAPPEQLTAKTDERSDIYSLGVVLFRLATGRLPGDINQRVRLRDYVSSELASIIEKCIKSEPSKRYQIADDLKSALDAMTFVKYDYLRRGVKRKVMKASAGILAAVFVITTSTGFYKLQQEKTVLIDLEPKILMLSAQETGLLSIKKNYSNGRETELPGDSVNWASSDLEVARVERGRVIAMNPGKAHITGRYNNKEFAMDVIVNSKDLTNVRLMYDTAYEANLLAGNGNRDSVDGSLKDAGFTEPSSITRLSDGTIYVIDSGVIRKIANNTVSTIHIQPNYVEPDIIRSNGKDEVYFASKEWIAADQSYQKGIFKLNKDNTCQLIWQSPAQMSTFSDFTFDRNGRMFTVEKDVFEEKSIISIIDLAGKSRPTILGETEFDISSIAVDNGGEIYVSSAEKAVIYRWDKQLKKMKYFAGVDGQKNFIDGKDNRFFEPLKIKICSNDLYVLDHTVIRKILINNGKIYDVRSVVGQVSEQKGSISSGKGYEIIWEKSGVRDFTLDEKGNLYVTDPAASLITEIRFNLESTQMYT